MSFFRNVLRESKTRFYQSFESNTHNIRLNQAIITISFDDVPRSAMENGLAILDKHSVKATFYIATGLAISENQNESETNDLYLDRQDIERLDQQGHDIGCHTYSHYRLNLGSADEMMVDVEKNQQTLSRWLDGKPIEHFSYPFGVVSLKAKKLLSKHYKTMRSSRPGINTYRTDFNLLRATSIYNPSFNESSMLEIITATVEQGGWLILYTHGVENNPEPYDCTPQQLDWVLAQAVASGAQILPVTKAYEAIIHASS